MTVFSAVLWNKIEGLYISIKSCHFEARKNIMTRFKPQALHIIRMKHWNASGNDNPPSLILALRKIAIYVLKMKFYELFCTRLYWLSDKKYSASGPTEFRLEFLKNSPIIPLGILKQFCSEFLDNSDLIYKIPKIWKTSNN